jgi:hypothetical protein
MFDESKCFPVDRTCRRYSRVRLEPRPVGAPIQVTPMTRDEVIKMVNPGIQRVKEFCAQHLAKGDYFPGCPAFVR